MPHQEPLLDEMVRLVADRIGDRLYTDIAQRDGELQQMVAHHFTTLTREIHHMSQQLTDAIARLQTSTGTLIQGAQDASAKEFTEVKAKIDEIKASLPDDSVAVQQLTALADQVDAAATNITGSIDSISTAFDAPSP